MERLLRRRKCLRSQLDDIVKEAEGILREQQEPATSQVSVLRDRIDALYLQIAKTDESILNETPDDLIESSIVHCYSVIVLRTCVEEDTVSEVLSRFWDLESVGVGADEESLLDSELTLQEFDKNITKRDGSYQVRLPWKKTADLADNFSVDTKRLGILMRKLSKDRSLLERYDKTIRGCLEEGPDYSKDSHRFRRILA
ncbi:hypothetical protein HPB49_006633 [Dermacentor silvarum]|uniref:Uncharacterized protein n=1 Tax=Dermacentor silvarum TaxID=543639 RepID=A0ACB8CQ98_DERSI|nr:hypothetical protein HPB49_006633 [Dermacentor silvarum]